MLKKLIIGVALVGVVLLAIKGTRFFGYMSNEIQSARSWLDDQVPVEKDIERLNKEVDKLDQDINKTKDNLAKELYAQEKLQKDIAAKRAKLESDKKDMLARHQILSEQAGEEKQVKFGNEKFTREVAQARLSSDSKLWDLENKSLTSQISSLQVVEQNVALLQEQRLQLETQKGELKVRLQKIAADYKALEVKKMETKYKKDDTRLSKIEKDLEKLEERLGVQQKRVAMDATTPSKGSVANQGESLDDIANRLKGDVK